MAITTTGLGDVPQPQQSGRHDHQPHEVSGQDEHRLVGADRWGEAPAEGGRREALEQRRRILSDEQVADPLVGAVRIQSRSPDVASTAAAIP
jgi:hypothetical protein